MNVQSSFCKTESILLRKELVVPVTTDTSYSGGVPVRDMSLSIIFNELRQLADECPHPNTESHMAVAFLSFVRAAVQHHVEVSVALRATQSKWPQMPIIFAVTSVLHTYSFGA